MGAGFACGAREDRARCCHCQHHTPKPQKDYGRAWHAFRCVPSDLEGARRNPPVPRHSPPLSVNAHRAPALLLLRSLFGPPLPLLWLFVVVLASSSPTAMRRLQRRLVLGWRTRRKLCAPARPTGTRPQGAEAVVLRRGQVAAGQREGVVGMSHEREGEDGVPC
jgi:hypothetical protein